MRIEEENLFESLFIASAGNISLAQLSDVADSLSPSSGQVLTWNGTMWVATTPSGGGGGGTSNVDVLNDLSDVSVSSATNGQVLTYNDTNNKWEPQTPSGGSSSNISSLGDLSNVSDSVDTAGMSGILWQHPSNDEWMRISLDTTYFTIDWNTYTLSLTNIGSGSGASQLKQLSDVNSNLSPSSGDILFYDNSLNKWNSKQLELEDLAYVDTTGAQSGYVLAYDGHGGWSAQASGGQSSTYYADGDTLSLSNNTFSVLSSPALYINSSSLYIPSPSFNNEDYKFLAVCDGNGYYYLDWVSDYRFDTEPSSGSANLVASGDLYTCFGSGVDGTTIEIDSSGKLHAISSTQLSGLSDVDSNLSPSNGQVLTYNNTNHQWEAQTPSGSSSSSLTWEEH